MLHSAISSLNVSRRTFVGAATSAAGLALAGCSGANSGSGSSTDSSKKTEITFCLDYTPNTNHTGIYVAKNKGYFADEGLKVKIVQPAEDTAETAIGSGDAQLGVSYQDYIACPTTAVTRASPPWRRSSSTTPRAS